jgi:hypothetical protein
MFQAFIVVPQVIFFVVLGAFALLLHSIPLLIDENLMPHGFDYSP